MISTYMFLFIAIIIDLTSSSAVIEVDDADFEESITEYEEALVMFYAPSCRLCQKLMPELDSASIELLFNDPPVRLWTVDCSEGGKKTCESFGVSSYPTLKMFKNGKILSKEYSGPTDGPGIFKYVAKQAGPGFVDINSKKEYKKFLASEGSEDLENRVLGFFRDSSSMRSAFTLVADSLREKFKFGIITLPELLKENDDKDGVVLFRPKLLQTVFEPRQLKYEGIPTKSAIESWLKANIHGLVDPINHENYEEFEKPLVVAYYDVDYENNAERTNYWRNIILKVAKGFASDFNFAIGNKEQHRNEIEIEFERKFPTSEEPTVLARDEDDKKFIMAEEFSEENFESFLRKLKNHEIEPYHVKLDFSLPDEL